MEKKNKVNNLKLSDSMRDWMLEKFKNTWKVIESDIDFSQHEPIGVSSSLHILQEEYIINDETYRLSYPISDPKTSPTIERKIKG